ncbi:MAG TPA: hypothetical protein VIH99_13340 [Bdellovibrionota bacterium]|jgi:hypothetical protein
MKANMSYRAAFLVMILFGCLSAHSAEALVSTEQKNLGGRIGLGFTNQMVVTENRTIPALSAKYYAGRATAFGLGVGFDTKSGDNSLALGLKGFKNVFMESNTIFYLGMGLAYVNHVGSKFQGSAFLGAEFFFERMPSLGFSFEAGVRGDSTSGSFAIRTIGDTFLNAGLHFYL